MKHFLLIIAVTLATGISSFAQGSSQIEKTVNEIVNKYDGSNLSNNFST